MKILTFYIYLNIKLFQVEEWKAEGIEIEKNKLEWEKILREEKAKEDEKKLANFKWFHGKKLLL